MEGPRTDDDDGGGVAGAGQERRRQWRGAAGGYGDEEESSHVGGGGVELSLRLRTGADDHNGAASAPPPPPLPVPQARRNMTIFYNGRVCAVDVTEVQARAIISMAREESTTLASAVDHRGQRHQDDGDSSSSSTSAEARRCARDRGLLARPAAALPAAGVVGFPGQGFVGGAVAAPAVEIDPAAAPTGRLSMKRSLQLFLQKRKARMAAPPPYAGGGARQAQAVRR